MALLPEPEFQLDYNPESADMTQPENVGKPNITDLDFPPDTWAAVQWGGAGRLVVDVSIWKDPNPEMDVTISGVKIVGGFTRPVKDVAGVFPPTAIVINGANWELNSHPYQSGDGPFRLQNFGTFPTGFAADTDYWIVRIDANLFRFAPDFDSAVRGKNTIQAVDAGTGTHTITNVGVDKTFATVWTVIDTIPAFELGVRRGTIHTFRHHPKYFGYALIKDVPAITRTIAVEFTFARTTIR